MATLTADGSNNMSLASNLGVDAAMCVLLSCLTTLLRKEQPYEGATV